MIHCKRFKADQSENTCIARQRTLHRVKTRNYGTEAIMASSFAGCYRCKIGLDLYRKSNEGVAFEKHKDLGIRKRCAMCGEDKPTDNDHYRKVGRGWSYTCLKCEERLTG